MSIPKPLSGPLSPDDFSNVSNHGKIGGVPNPSNINPLGPPQTPDCSHCTGQSMPGFGNAYGEHSYNGVPKHSTPSDKS